MFITCLTTACNGKFVWMFGFWVHFRGYLNLAWCSMTWPFPIFFRAQFAKKYVSSWTKRQSCQRKTEGRMCHRMRKMEKSWITLSKALWSTTHTAHRAWTVGQNGTVNLHEGLLQSNFVLLSCRFRDALCLFEVSEKPCNPGQIQNVLQKSSQHGHIFPGISSI